MLILINGAKRSGKDESAKILNKLIKEAQVLSFAKPMKHILAQTLGVSESVLEGLKNNEDMKIQFKASNGSIVSSKHNVRKALQIFGTDAMKPYFGEEVWGKLLLNSKTATVCIVSDFRYPEEIRPIIASDEDVYTILIKRDLVSNSGDTHSSENSLKDFDFDFAIENNGSLADLEDKLKIVLEIIESTQNTKKG